MHQRPGPFQSYESKAFYLPVPPTKDVLNKRVTFLKDKLQDATGQRHDYFLKKGIRLSLSDIKAFAACIEEIFIKTDFISRTISWICNYDIRRSLTLSSNILTSPHLKIDELVKTYLAENQLKISEPTIRRALFLGDYNQYRQDENSFVVNLFSIFPDAIGTPLAKLSVLQALKDKQSLARDPDEAYLEVADLASYLEPLGLTPLTVRKHLVGLLEYRLIEPYDPACEKLDDSTTIKITPNGCMHIEFALSDPSYIEHVGLSTAVRDCSTIDELRELFSGNRVTKLSGDDWKHARELFCKYCLDQDSLFCKVPEQFEGQHQMRQQFRNRWLGKAGT